MKPPLSNIAASVRQRLLNLSQKRGEEFQSLLVRYANERLIYRLAVAREIDALHAWRKHGRRRVLEKAERLSRAGRLVENKIMKGPHRGMREWRTEWRSPAAKRKRVAAWKKAEAQDQQMLLRRMAIRERLWT